MRHARMYSRPRTSNTSSSHVVIISLLSRLLVIPLESNFSPLFHLSASPATGTYEADDTCALLSVEGPARTECYQSSQRLQLYVSRDVEDDRQQQQKSPAVQKRLIGANIRSTRR
jgi:hypothetical protein